MKIDGKPYRSIWMDENDKSVVRIIDQRFLPYQLKVRNLESVEDCAMAIREMLVRGAPLIGVAAAFGIYLACLKSQGKENPEHYLDNCADLLLRARPTAVNLRWAVLKMKESLREARSFDERVRISWEMANSICENDVENCKAIGKHGIDLIRNAWKGKGKKTINILTHCNAGWLACVDWGTATSPIYQAFDEGIDLHIWVDETRPRNQGSKLTAWELGNHGIPYTIITDNAGGHLMQKGKVDMCIVGSDRTTRTGDVANKIGTYLKALAAMDNKIPFYVALPTSTIDLEAEDGLKDIPIEERDPGEVLAISAWNGKDIGIYSLAPEGAHAANFGFDITPGRLVSSLITERGICPATKEGIAGLFKSSLSR